MVRLFNKKYFIVVIILALIFFLHTTSIILPLESFIVKAVKYPLKYFYSYGFKIRSTYDLQTNKIDLADKIKEQEETISQLSVDYAKLKILEDENKFLRQQLKFLNTNQYHNYVLANIISRGDLSDITENNQTITIDKGEKEGIYPGLAVISPAIYTTSSLGVIIGKVVNTKEHLAEVLLTINKECKLAVSLLNQNKTSGIVHGDLGLTVKMEFIPQTEEINKGDLVITSGLEKNIPQGLVIGKITDVTKETNALWQNATIEPFLDTRQLLIVSVLIQ